jgi:lipid A 3-O-deacylase
MWSGVLTRWFGAALACVPFAATGHANDILHELKLGVLSHDLPGLWAGYRREAVAADINIEAQLKPALDVGIGSVRPALGGTINTIGQTSHVYADARWTYDAPSGVFVSLGLGAALHDGHTNTSDPNRKALGTHGLFHIPAEAGYRFAGRHSISVYFEHTSNANSQTFNEGIDRLGVRYGYLF